jgi:hypothetical protein
MKGLKIFLLVIIPILLLIGLYSKIKNTDFFFAYGNVEKGVTKIDLTGNEILAAAFVLTVPLMVIFKNEKDNR